MKIRPILTGLLVMLLLCGSSWAAACDLSCGLRGAVPVCHGADDEQAGVGMAMAGGECHGMASTQQDPVSVSSECGPQGCGHQLAPAERAGEVDIVYGAVPSLISAEIDALEAPVFRGTMIRLAVPRGDPSGFDPLLVSLRV